MKNMQSAKLNLTPGKYPKENVQDSEHGENLKSRISVVCLTKRGDNIGSSNNNNL
jgi:hypothetical protein